MIKVEAVYKQVTDSIRKFERFDVTIGNVTRECPVSYMRISEVPLLQELLEEAFNLGHGPTPAPYDKTFGDDVLCECGHPYYRHFDTYEDMSPIGCKYCDCEEGFRVQKTDKV